MDKSIIKQFCLEKVLQKIDEIQTLISDAQESANSETKSTAGDKHETSRAQAHIETDRLKKQLHQLNESYKTLKGIPTDSHKQVSLGSFVKTTQGDFYVSIGLGALKTKEYTFFAISLNAPLGQKLSGKRVGDSFEMPNGKRCEVLGVI